MKDAQCGHQEPGSALENDRCGSTSQFCFLMIWSWTAPLSLRLSFPPEDWGQY
jgi:hypothetical protein